MATVMTDGGHGARCSYPVRNRRTGAGPRAGARGKEQLLARQLDAVRHADEAYVAASAGAANGLVRTAADNNNSAMSMLISATGYFDSALEQMLTPAYVLTDNASIVWADRRPPPAELTASAERVSLPGQYLLPGLIDSHVHLAFDSEASDCVAVLSERDDERLLADMAQRARRAARAGVTTLRDLGDRSFLTRRLADRADEDLPTIVTAGPPLTIAGGHCHFLGGVVDGDGPDVVARHAEQGVDFVKVMVTGGILTSGSAPGQVQFDVHELRSIVNAARAFGLPVAAHAHSTAGIRLAVQAGVQSIEHCTFSNDLEFDLDPALVAELVSTGTWVCPTYVDTPTVSWDPEHFAWRRHVLGRLRQAGVRLAFGSDAGVKRGLHHDSARWSVTSFVSAGLPAPAALAAATLGAARACRVEDRKGRLSPGADADIIAVRDDPLTDPTTLVRPSFVMIRGRMVSPSTDPAVEADCPGN
ncbi:amidohydrolase family protein [Verrucosispora sp. WMMD573]|uniref:amidohydrolase family protein n=1 Tax=Verrucosispora sp. WMMD573 TaxID=3015149 RepID=UPI00248BA067|nr:amidohydrolase family protein [Verrucosispora sp. WMMD573]WBB53712.1 amidohydrolase family protein [Verrucosispora sp. WMMD573]